MNLDNVTHNPYLLRSTTSHYIVIIEVHKKNHSNKTIQNASTFNTKPGKLRMYLNKCTHIS